MLAMGVRFQVPPPTGIWRARVYSKVCTHNNTSDDKRYGDNDKLQLNFPVSNLPDLIRENTGGYLTYNTSSTSHGTSLQLPHFHWDGFSVLIRMMDD